MHNWSFRRWALPGIASWRWTVSITTSASTIRTSSPTTKVGKYESNVEDRYQKSAHIYRILSGTICRWIAILSRFLGARTNPERDLFGEWMAHTRASWSPKHSESGDYGATTVEVFAVILFQMLLESSAWVGDARGIFVLCQTEVLNSIISSLWGEVTKKHRQRLFSGIYVLYL